MTATDILSNEHRVIEQVLACLKKIAQQALEAGKLDKGPAEDAIEFLRTFADRCHHGKEEVHLFPAMEARGFPHDTGPIGVMLLEHREGRSDVTAMAESLDGAAVRWPRTGGLQTGLVLRRCCRGVFGFVLVG